MRPLGLVCHVLADGVAFDGGAHSGTISVACIDISFSRTISSTIVVRAIGIAVSLTCLDSPDFEPVRITDSKPVFFSD